MSRCCWHTRCGSWVSASITNATGSRWTRRYFLAIGRAASRPWAAKKKERTRSWRVVQEPLEELLVEQTFNDDVQCHGSPPNGNRGRPYSVPSVKTSRASWTASRLGLPHDGPLDDVAERQVRVASPVLESMDRAKLQREL